MRLLARAAILAASVALLPACTGTKMVQVWRDPKWQAQVPKRAFIACVMANDKARVAYENTLAQALLEKGILSATSTGVFGYSELDRDKAERWVRENQVDMVFVQRMTKDIEANFMPGTLDYVPVSTYYTGWWGSYGYGDGFFYTSAYMEDDVTVRTDTQVYWARTDPETLVWSGRSSTINVQDAHSAAKSLQSALLKDLVKAGILPK